MKVTLGMVTWRFDPHLLNLTPLEPYLPLNFVLLLLYNHTHSSEFCECIYEKVPRKRLHYCNRVRFCFGFVFKILGVFSFSWLEWELQKLKTSWGRNSKSLLFQAGCIRNVQRLLYKTFHFSLVFQVKALGIGGLPEVISVRVVHG